MASNEIEVLDPEATVDNLKQSAATRVLDRRHFMAALGMAGAAAGAAMMTGCTTDNTVYPPYVTPGADQPNVVNFLLNVKYLKATLYSYITTGKDLPMSVLAGAGTLTNPPSQLTFTGTNAQQITDLFNEMYFAEISHVNALRTSLGPQAVPRPAINLSATGSVTASNVVAISRALEDLSATTFAAALTAFSASNLSNALQTLSVDGFHAGALRLLSIQSGVAPTKIDSIDVVPFDPGTAALSAAGPTASGGFFATAGAASSSATVPAGSAFVRASSQALAFLYGSAAAGTTSGGYFPNGVNGSIKSV